MENSNYRRTEINPAHQHFFLGLVRMTLGLYMVLTAYQTVKIDFTLHPVHVSLNAHYYLISFIISPVFL